MNPELKNIKPLILITNAHERSAQIAIKSLINAGFKVEISSSKKFIHLIRDIKKLYIHPCPSIEYSEFFFWLTQQIEANDNLIVLPINESILFACNEVRFKYPGFRSRIIMPSQESLKFALSKYEATQAAQNSSIITPKTYFLKRSSDEVINWPKNALKFPVIVKWDNFLFENKYNKGSLRIVTNEEEFRDTVMELVPLKCSIIVQEFVHGYGVGAFFLRKNGKIILRFAHKRLHEVPWTGGVSAYCESSNDFEVLEAGERLLNAINYDGLAMVEFRKEEGKPPVFLEINGRLWGSSGLSYAAGADFPKAMIEYHLKGETSVKQPDLNKKTQWHEPRFEMLYLQSIKTERSKILVEGPNLSKARKNVLLNFINPAVKSDWWINGDIGSSLRFYLGLLKGEFLKVKRNFLKEKRNEIDPLVLRASERSKDFFVKNTKLKNILFVCYGNICRSPYAEFRWNQFRNEHKQLPKAISVGFHDHVNRQTPLRFQSVANHLGVNLDAHRSKRITKTLIDEADVLIAMDLRNLKDIQREFPDAMQKTILLGGIFNFTDVEIDDPYGKNMGIGGAIYRRMDKELIRLKEILLSK